MVTIKPRIEDLMPITCRVDRKFSGIASMMTYVGRLVHLKSMISAMSIFAMCSIKIQFTMTDHLEKTGRNFLWYGKDINKQGKCLVKWEIVCLPKDAGGLGVLDLRQHNKTLLVKKIFRFFNRENITWVELIWIAYYDNNNIPNEDDSMDSFWWRDCCKLIPSFKDMTSCSVNRETPFYYGLITGMMAH